MFSARTRGEDIFNAINSYSKDNGIDWFKCNGLCTDSAKSMSEIYSGLRCHVIKLASNINWSHCCIHRKELILKNFHGDLKVVLEEAVKVANFTKSTLTNSRRSKALCHEMKSVNSTLLFHTELRWLSRGKVLTRLLELRQEIQLSSKLHDKKWLQALAYLSDIFYT